MMAVLAPLLATGVASPDSQQIGAVAGANTPQPAGHGAHRGPHKVYAQQESAAAAAVPPFRTVVDSAGFLIPIPQATTSDAASAAVVGVVTAFGALVSLTALLFNLA